MRHFVLTCLLAVALSCGGSSVPDGPAVDLPQPGDCELDRFSQPPPDEGQTPPSEATSPGDTPQPRCADQE